MKLFLLVATVVVSCQASVFVYAPKGKGCSYPNWKCDCELIYNCGASFGFPDLPTTNAGHIKDLAPDEYQLRIPGKRWRREIWSQEEFCKRECYDRLNAFLCLDADNELSDYSYLAICLKLSGPFPQDPPEAQPCCEIYLLWGLDWCPDKWHKLLGTVRCYGDRNFDSDDGSVIDEIALTAAECNAPGDADGWCANTPNCPAAP